MGSIGNPRTWVPYMNTKDCSQGFCSWYCPQWCYIIFPPPPPIEFPDDDSGPNFSPLVIAILGILASAFLLVSYYTIISKYCGNPDSTRRRENPDTSEVLEDNHNPSTHEPWQTSTTGLDEALIKSITVCKYKKGDCLIEGTDCSVCLSEFQEDDSLRLLPKCSHAFHVHCIDTWLRSHSNCPLCRANIIFISVSPLPLPTPVTESPPGNESLQDRQPVTNENVAAAQETGRRRTVQEVNRVQSDLGDVQGRDTVIEIGEEGYQQMRRSVSMDHFCQTQRSVADILPMNQEEDTKVEEFHLSSGIAGSSKQPAEGSKVSNKLRVLQYCVMNPAAMKRSFSSGRFFLTRQGRVRDPTISL
ncbi:E3 ubiquitin-protein ligase Os04g0590900-like [Durio zibethinus]|uniref:RING-type E3 ubiquitin transferase n=1 Tax=Durio zibethinus TaxID=66656 RepID=A0A6P5YCR9_DURZI|nr:E3 ubiquitin-protein ligase Os04g0590900-like [Durio zibethinus]